MEPVFEIDETVSYEWCHFAAYPHPSNPGRYAVFTNSGCSCDYWEHPTVEEARAEVPLSRPQVRKAMTEFMDYYKAYINAGEAIRNLERFETEMNAVELL